MSKKKKYTKKDLIYAFQRGYLFAQNRYTTYMPNGEEIDPYKEMPEVAIKQLLKDVNGIPSINNPEGRKNPR